MEIKEKLPQKIEKYSWLSRTFVRVYRCCGQNHQIMENNKYKFYRLGQEAKKANKPVEAIENYKMYSQFLDEKDKHIPFLWIHHLLFELERYQEAKDSLLIFAKGCSYPHASKVLKEKSKLYENIDSEINKLLVLESENYKELQKKITQK